MFNKKFLCYRIRLPGAVLLLDQGYYRGVHRGEAAVVGVKGGVEGGGVGERVGGWEGADKETNTGGGEGVGGSTFRSQFRVGS